MTKQKGFTFIEIITYVAILAVLSVLVVNAILAMTKSFGKFRTARQINLSAETALERMVREIRLADGLDASRSVFNAHPGRLSLKTINPLTGAPATLEFFLATTILMFQAGASDPEPLTSSKTEVANLVFRLIETPFSKAIKIELELQAGKGHLEKSEQFYTTAILRRSYQ